MTLITLLTDFGIQDEYAGVLKGVIYGINPAVTVVDLTHQVAPQDIVQAAYTLQAAFRFFPAGSIHLVVVDPGVGSARSILAARCGGHTFIAPDNGLLQPLWEDQGPETLVRVQRPDLYLQPVSATFHGRDVFAPVAAHLSRGLALEDLGPPLRIAETVPLDRPQPHWCADGTLEGCIVAIDHFGNLTTNISAQILAQWTGASAGRGLRVQVGGCCLDGVAASYAEALPGQPLAIIGSRNKLEIAVNGGHAARQLDIGRGGLVRVTKGH